MSSKLQKVIKSKTSTTSLPPEALGRPLTGYNAMPPGFFGTLTLGLVPRHVRIVHCTVTVLFLGGACMHVKWRRFNDLSDGPTTIILVLTFG